MDVLITHPEDGASLEREVARVVPGARLEASGEGVYVAKGLTGVAGGLGLVFVRQMLPSARRVSAPSIRGWAEQLVAALPGLWGGGGGEPTRWRLHLWPRYGDGQAGWRRCRLIEGAVREVLGRHHRRYRRCQEEATTPWTEEHGLIQLMLTAPDHGFLSLDPAPGPYQRRGLVAPFVAGEIPVAVDKSAPSRAFAKLVEAELRLGCAIRAGEACVDLGACPGSWSYVALGRGASVVAVDRAELRPDLMRHARLTFRRGDAFTFEPDRVMDWLLCDVIAAPERSIDLLLRWLREGWCRRFVVSIKFKGTDGYERLDPLRAQLGERCTEFRLTRLCANRNEACAVGVAAAPASAAW